MPSAPVSGASGRPRRATASIPGCTFSARTSCSANQTPYASELDRLLSLDEVTGHELVYGELLIGDRGGRGKFLAAYGQMQQASIVPHHEVVVFVRDRDLHGRGVGWIDIHLLASAIVGRLQLWTADPRFAARAKELGVGY